MHYISVSVLSSVFFSITYRQPKKLSVQHIDSLNHRCTSKAPVATVAHNFFRGSNHPLVDTWDRISNHPQTWESSNYSLFLSQTGSSYNCQPWQIDTLASGTSCPCPCP